MSRDNSSNDPLPECQLVVLAQAGDRDAQEQIVSLFGGIEPICGHPQGGGLMLTLAKNSLAIYDLGHNDDAVNDVVSETYLSVLDPATARYDPLRGTVVQYLVGLARNAARKIARQYGCVIRDHGLHAGRDENQADSGVSPGDESPDLARDGEDWPSEAYHTETPDAILIEHERQDFLAQRIARVVGMESPVLQSAMRQHYWMDVPVSVLADRFGMERTGLVRKMAACRERLARDLQDLSSTAYYN